MWIKGLTINTRETQKAVMAVKTNHSPRGCSFRWGGAAIAQTKHTWKKSHNNWNSQWWFWINAQQTIESEIPASFSKPGMERRYIGSHRRFVWRDVYVIFTLSNRLHFPLLLFRSASQRQTKQTKSNIRHLDVGLSHLSLGLIFHCSQLQGILFDTTPNSSPHTMDGGYLALL